MENPCRILLRTTTLITHRGTGLGRSSANRSGDEESCHTPDNNERSPLGLPAAMMKLMALALAAAGVQAATPNTSRRQMQVRKPLGARE
jgi:hypothetical protein